MPVLDDALAWLACDLEALHPGGDHTIGIGRVTHMDADPDAASRWCSSAAPSAALAAPETALDRPERAQRAGTR